MLSKKKDIYYYGGKIVEMITETELSQDEFRKIFKYLAMKLNIGDLFKLNTYLCKCDECSVLIGSCLLFQRIEHHHQETITPSVVRNFESIQD